MGEEQRKGKWGFLLDQHDLKDTRLVDLRISSQLLMVGAQASFNGKGF